MKTDWLASNPVFYNENTKKASHNINDVIDFKNIVFHPEGLYNYIDFGYSVFEQTPLRGVKFLPPNATIIKGKISYQHDPSDIEITGNVFELIQSKVNTWERTVREVVLPLSGGYDSRMLACMVNKYKTFAFTYGISSRQYDSIEVVKAKKVCKILGITWKRITLGDYHNYINDWIRWYGPGVHAHGMYHIEFYKKIYAPAGIGLLSGIGGDLLSNQRTLIKNLTPANLTKLGHNHNIAGDISQLNFSPDLELREQYLREKKYRLKDIKYQTIETIRLKAILLSYLLTLPRRIGFNSYSPYMDPEVAMLMLAQDKRKNRQWVLDFFTKQGVNLSGLKYTRANTLNFQAILRYNLKPLDVNLLSELFNPRYVKWINNKLMYISQLRRYRYRLMKTPYIKEGLKRIRFSEDISKAYFAYLTLKPLETILKHK